MTFEQRARSASAAVRRARAQSRFTSKPPVARGPAAGLRTVALGAACVVVVFLVALFGTLPSTFPPSGSPLEDSAGGGVTTPLTTPFEAMPGPDIQVDSAWAVRWREIVSSHIESRNMPFDSNDLEVWETPEPVAKGGSLSAVIDSPNGMRVFVADFQAFVPGEYQEDPDWIASVAGSRLPGEETTFGTLFETYSGGRRAAVLVTKGGVLYLGVQGSDESTLLTSNQLREFALALVAALSEVAVP